MASRRASPTSAQEPVVSTRLPQFVCVQAKAGALALLNVSVVPNAKRTEVVGLHDGNLRVRLAAPPVDGKANDTLTAWVAEQLGLPKRAVRLLRGMSSRQKQLEIDLAAPVVQQWVVQCLKDAQAD